MRSLATMVGLGLVAACGDNLRPADNDIRGPYVLLDFTRPTLFSAPVPAWDLTTEELAGIANPLDSAMVEQARELLANTRGFSRAGGVFFQISEPLAVDELPGIAETVAADSPVMLVDVDPLSPELGRRIPLEVSFRTDASGYGAPNLLALVPLQGVPLHRRTRYVAIVTTALHAASGPALLPAPASVLDNFRAVIAAAGVPETAVAGVTAFDTGDPTAGLAAARTAALALPLPTLASAPTQTDLFSDFCVFQSTIGMPDWQSGAPPFATDGGTWELDANGAPIVQRTEVAKVVITLPRTAKPTAGYPLVVFVRTGAGGDRPLVDRGQQSMDGGPPIVVGEGPARYLARAGFAAIQVDGPLGGLRNPTSGDEQFLTLNLENLGALRDNLREAAVELDVIAHVATTLHVSGTSCPGAASDATFDAAHFAIMGHGMGAWIAQLAAAYEPLFGAQILSGAGASWIATLLNQQKPLALRPLVASLLREQTIDSADPILTIVQWALEPADPQVYASSARPVLQIEGVVDSFAPPRMANASSLALRLDLAGSSLDDAADPRLVGQLPLVPLLALVGRSQVALPATGSVIAQFAEDGVEDGHEVLYQVDSPKHGYRCFLASWLTGTPTLPVAASRDAPCP
ncbi:MAG TPA: hypothetical protein VFV99_05425 [Kofleriaceae bacterium]|nr:hypothetical protein [Kofleriaceae bacterium]